MLRLPHGSNMQAMNISKYEKAGQIGKLYEEYTALWEEIKTLETNSATYDEDLKLRVWNEMVNMISNNASEFCEVTTSTEIIQVLQSVNANSDNIESAFLKKSVEALKANIETTTKKLESVTTGSGE